MSFQNCHIVGSNIDSDKYHADRAKHERGTQKFVMSPSSLNAFAKLPSRWRRGWNPPESKAKDFGSLLDTRALTPKLFSARYAIQPETYPVDTLKCPGCGSVSDSKKCSRCKTEREPHRIDKPWRYGASHCDDWKAKEECAGRHAVTAKDVAQADAALNRLLEPVDGDDTIQRWFEACEKQVLIEGEWCDDETGLVIPVSCLLDFVPRADSEFASCLGDLKTSISAHPLVFQRHAFKFGYHRQAAFDMDMYKAALPEEDRNTWCFIIVESFDPWEPNRAIYGQEGSMGQPGFIELGRKSGFGGYEGVLSNYCKCLKANKWPTYNHIDEAVQGWCVLRPEAFDAERASYQPKYEFPAAEVEAPETEPHDPDDVLP